MHHIDLMACPRNNLSFKLHFVFLFGACDVFHQQVKFEFAFELLEPCGEVIEISFTITKMQIFITYLNFAWSWWSL